MFSTSLLVKHWNQDSSMFICISKYYVIKIIFFQGISLRFISRLTIFVTTFTSYIKSRYSLKERKLIFTFKCTNATNLIYCILWFCELNIWHNKTCKIRINNCSLITRRINSIASTIVDSGILHKFHITLSLDRNTQIYLDTHIIDVLHLNHGRTICKWS